MRRLLYIVHKLLNFRRNNDWHDTIFLSADELHETAGRDASQSGGCEQLAALLHRVTFLIFSICRSTVGLRFTKLYFHYSLGVRMKHRKFKEIEIIECIKYWIRPTISGFVRCLRPKVEKYFGVFCRIQIFTKYFSNFCIFFFTKRFG